MLYAVYFVGIARGRNQRHPRVSNEAWKMAPWLRVLEAYLVQALLRTPAFHRGVEKVARQVHRFRHGTPPEEMGGTKIDDPNKSGFAKHFYEELQTQLGRAEAKNGESTAMKTMGDARGGRGSHVAEQANKAEEETADAVWESAKKTPSEGPKQGFLGEYIGVIKEQLRGGK